MNRILTTRSAAAALLAGSFLLLQGCSSLGIGEDEFSCPGKPGGAQCKSSWELYEMTNNGAVPAPMKAGDAENEGAEAAAQGGVNEDYVNTSDADFIVDNYVAPRLPDRPVPVRTPSQVMRIWIAPYDDTDGDFIVSGYAYTEIEPRRWTLGVIDTRSATGRVFEPLKAEKTTP